MGPSGEVFASYSRIAVPSVDADGRVIPGRPMQVRYDLKLDPSVYGGEEAFRSLRVLPFRKFTGDEAKVDRHFQRYLDKARRKFFEHVQSRPPSGPVEELLRQHNGDVEQLVASGHLGHENVLQERPGQKLRTFASRKPIGERGIVQLVMHWKAQHPTVVEGIRAHANRTYPVLDDAVIDDAIERGVGKAIHRFDASRGATFRAFARRTALGEISEAARQSGAGYGVERFAADDDVYDPRQDPNHPAGPAAADSEPEPRSKVSQARSRAQAGNGADEPPAPRPVAPSRHAPRPSRTTERDTLHQPHGSLSEFRQALEQALPGDEKAHAAISALHPTGDFPAGANLMEAARRTGLSLDELGKYRPVIERLKSHPAYRRYYDQHLRDVDAAREERMERSLDRTRVLAPVQHYHRAIEAIRGEARVASIVSRRTTGRRS